MCDTTVSIIKNNAHAAQKNTSSSYDVQDSKCEGIIKITSSQSPEKHFLELRRERTCVERLGGLILASVTQLHKVAAPWMDDQSVFNGDFDSWGELADVCEQIVLTYLARIDPSNTRWTVNILVRVLASGNRARATKMWTRLCQSHKWHLLLKATLICRNYANRVHSETSSSVVIYSFPNPHEKESNVHWGSIPVSSSHALAQKETTYRGDPDAEGLPVFLCVNSSVISDDLNSQMSWTYKKGKPREKQVRAIWTQHISVSCCPRRHILTTELIC